MSLVGPPGVPAVGLRFLDLSNDKASVNQLFPLELTLVPAFPGYLHTQKHSLGTACISEYD